MRRYAVASVALLVALLTTLVLAGCGPSSAVTPKMDAALDAMTRLQSKVKAGAVYADYSKAVGDTQGEVDIFIQSSEAKSRPDVATALKNAMSAYVGASSLWNFKIQTAGRQVWASRLPEWPSLVEKYPVLQNATTPMNVFSGSGPRTELTIDTDYAMQALWQAAGESATAAQAAAQK